MICTSTMAGGVERGADRADAAVHHVGGRDDVAAGLGLDQRLLHQHGDGLVVEDRAVAHQAVVAVAGVGIERDVAQDADLRHRLLDGADRAADEVVGVERLAAVLVAQLRVGVGKQRDAGDGQLRPRARPRAPRRRRTGARRPASRRPARGGLRRRTAARSGRRWSARSRAPCGAPIRCGGCGASRVVRSSESAGSVRRLGRDDANAGFDRAAVFDRHDCGFLDADLFYPVRAAPASRPTCR